MKVEIVMCSNFILWYRDRVGEVFEVASELPAAYYVHVDDVIDWIYKTDVRILNEV